MSDRKDDDRGEGKEGSRQYSVDEILEEFGSNRPKVVDFPPPEKRPRVEQGKAPAPRPPGQNTIRFPAVKGADPEDSDLENAARAARARTALHASMAEADGVQGTGKAHGQPAASRDARRTGEGQRPPKARAPVDRPPPPKPREPVQAKEDEPRDDRMVDISPEGPLRRLAAWLSVFDRRTDHYADHMYDQAEVDEETRKAEKYIPGVDREEIRAGRAKSKKRRRPLPPDVEPGVLAKRYAKGLKSKKVRLVLAALFAALCAVCSLTDLVALGAVQHLPEGLTAEEARLILLLGSMGVTALLCIEVPVRGLMLLFTLHMGPETVTALAFLATLADGLYLLLEGGREGLPCCAVASVGMVLALWGSRARRQGDRLSARAAAQTKAPFVVTLDEDKWSSRPAYAKWIGTREGFGSRLQAEDGVHLAYQVAAPLLILACFVCAAMSGAEGGGTPRFLWTLSSTLTAAAAWAAPLVYTLPYQKLARRLFDMGAALAGWPGTARCRQGGILMSDNDLFPTGAVQVSGIRVFGEFSNEKVVSYTATLLRVLNCGLTAPFRDLVHAQGTFYREVSGVRFHEGGVTGIIREHEVFVGTADFMHLMDVDLPQGLSVKHAVFCAINGELAGIFSLKYAMGQTVRPCLSALMDAGIRPVVATRDPNLIPNFLREKFKLPVDRMEFPPVERRLQLSDPAQEHDESPVALLSREGLAPYCDAVVGGKRLRSAVWLGTAFSLAGGAAGIAITFYLTYLGAVASLTAGTFLLFMAFWLVPAALINLWVDRF